MSLDNLGKTVDKKVQLWLIFICCKGRQCSQMDTYQDNKIAQSAERRAQSAERRAQSAERRAQSAERIIAPENRCFSAKAHIQQLISSHHPAIHKPSYLRLPAIAHLVRTPAFCRNSRAPPFRPPPHFNAACIRPERTGLPVCWRSQSLPTNSNMFIEEA